MKKELFVLPVLAVLFAACTSDELVVDEYKGQQTEEDGAIAFDAYLNRALTRAGYAGELTTSTGTKNLQTEGFGVFAYYVDGGLYSENAIPNFMYNQQVTYSTDWTYSPIKYWPNEFGSDAVSTNVDRVTFFAYAPYVGVEPTTGQLTDAYDNSETALSTETGITALTRNSKGGDPYVRYVGAFDPDKCVDLCYGVAAAAYTSSAAGVGAADGANSIAEGAPYINVVKPQIGAGGKLNFNFKHALAKLNVQVDADVDIVDHATSPTLDDNTRVWVRSITFDGIAQRGYLNLNNGMWYDVIDNNRISHASVTIHDGRHNGAEALADDSYETPIGFNAALVQRAVYTTEETPNAKGVPEYTTFTSTTTGVTATPQNLFAGTGNLLVIPSNEPLRVTIVYDVETADATLPKFLSDGTTRGSTIENKITKAITVSSAPLKLEAGKAYSINLHLGMTSVTFDATVSDWVDGGTSDVDLPQNMPQFPASGTPHATTIPGSATTYTFAITGLTGGETPLAGALSGFAGTPTVKVNSTSNFSGEGDNHANPSGVAYIQVTSITPYTDVVNNATPGVITLTRSDASTVVVNVTQLAEKLNLTVPATKTAGNEYTYTSNATTGKWEVNSTGAISDDHYIKVWHNGAPLTDSGDSAPSTGQFKFVNGVLTLGTATVDNDIIKVTIKTGDVPEETVSFKVGS